MHYNTIQYSTVSIVYIFEVLPLYSKSVNKEICLFSEPNFEKASLHLACMTQHQLTFHYYKIQLKDILIRDVIVLRDIDVLIIFLCRYCFDTNL